MIPAATSRPVVAFDWSRKKLHVTFDGDTVETFASFPDLLADPRLAVPHNIATENTFESWDHDNRAKYIAAARAAGHDVFMYRPLHTSKARKVNGDLKGDAGDACIIWRLATNPTFMLYRAVDPDQEWIELNSRLNAEYVRVRYEGAKDDLAKRAAKILGPIKQRSLESQLALGASSGYSPSLLAALMFAADNGLTRNQMERLFGLHGSGHPSLLRSEVHKHAFGNIRNRLLKADGVHGHRAVLELAGQQRPSVGDEPPPVKDMTLFRRELRRAYHEIRAGLAAQDDAA